MHPFRQRFARCRIEDEPGIGVTQVEPVVEAIGEGTEVGLGVLAVLQRLEGARHHCLEVSQHGLDPLELGQVPMLQRSHHLGLVNAAGLGDCSEAPQSVAGDNNLGLQTGFSPMDNRLECEAPDDAELNVLRLACGVHRHGGNEGSIVFRTSPDLAASVFATQVSVVQLHSATQQSSRLPGGHGVVDFVVHQPGRGVADGHITLEDQGRDAGLRLVDEVEGQKPGRQRQLSLLHQGACRQRPLVSAFDVLVQLAAAVTHHVMFWAVAHRTVKPLRPVRLHERLWALHLCAEVRQKLRYQHA
jgi:hypothetical protein